MRLLLCLILFSNIVFGLGDIDHDIEYKRALYTLPEGKTFLDITDRVLAQETLPEAHKQKFIEKNRRFVLFSYPSDGMQIKSLLSYVEGTEDPSHILFLRGSGQLESIPIFSPYDANYPYLLETYATLVFGSSRDCLSPGKE